MEITKFFRLVVTLVILAVCWLSAIIPENSDVVVIAALSATTLFGANIFVFLERRKGDESILPYVTLVITTAALGGAVGGLVSTLSATSLEISGLGILGLFLCLLAWCAKRDFAESFFGFFAWSAALTLAVYAMFNGVWIIVALAFVLSMWSIMIDNEPFFSSE